MSEDNKDWNIPFEYKFAIVVRKDLDMGCGKIAAQVGHAVATMMNEPSNPVREAWFAEGQRKVCLKIQSEEELKSIGNSASESGLSVYYIRDAGRTQVTPGSMTCIGIGPAKEAAIDAVVGALKLL